MFHKQIYTLKIIKKYNFTQWYLIVFFLGICALFDHGKCALFQANVSKITWLMCHCLGKCAILNQGKCEKGQMNNSQLYLHEKKWQTLHCSKTLRAHFEQPKTLRGADWGVQNSAGKFAFHLCSTKFWTPQSVPPGVLDPSKLARRSLGAMQCLPRFFIET